MAHLWSMGKASPMRVSIGNLQYPYSTSLRLASACAAVLTLKAFSPPFLRVAAIFVLMAFHCSSTNASNKMRIASLNLCTDSMLFELAEPSQIASVTALSKDEKYSHYSELAQHIRINRGLAEEIIVLEPDLVLAGSYTATGTTTLLRQLGYRVLTFQPALDIDEFRNSFLRLAAVIGAIDKANQLLTQMDKEIAEIMKPETELWPRAIIYQPNGFSPGFQSLANEMLNIAGIANLAVEFNIEYGGFVPLEQLVIAKPNVIILPDQIERFPALANIFLTHPALSFTNAQEITQPPALQIKLPEKYWSCGGTFIAAAAARLAMLVSE